MRDITITRIGFSPDKMERVVLYYSVKKALSLHAKEDTVELPRVTYTKKYNKETGEMEEHPVNALKGGHFTAHFQRRAVRAVLEHFFPKEEANLKALLRAVDAIKAAATELEHNPLEAMKTVLNLKAKLIDTPRLTDDLLAAWKVLVDTRARLYGFGRGLEDEDDEE